MSISYIVREGVACIRFSRPEKLNALTLQMYEELGQAFNNANEDETVRTVLLTGEGDRAFCVGADLLESIPALAEGRFDISEWDAAHLKMTGFYKPVITAINGMCMGGGFEIMLASDIRIASSDAVFSLPEISLGIVPAGGTLVRLVRQIPYAYAMELMLSAERFSAARLAEMGVINKVVPAGELADVAWRYASALAKRSPVATAVIKEAALALYDLPYSKAFKKEAELGQRAFTSDQAQQGLNRFKQSKRTG